ncbi:MAG TPA: glycosyltransferase family 2 protein [Acidimicrobiales bacterium]|nr:glycosyltransferase family 2 protein [Acidimicrobiales bacterium]
MSGSARGPDGTAPSAADRVAAVVVNFESGTALTECLRTLAAESPAEVVVVDNGSRDGSILPVRRDFPAVEVVVPGRNLGYGAAANRGAAATTAELILVCNSDLSVHEGALAGLVAVLDQQPEVAVTGPLIRTPAGDRYPSARRFPSLVDAAGHAALGLFAPDNRFTRNYQQSDISSASGAPQRVDWLSGACFLVRRSAFEAVGGFDEAYFMYAEDADLCWRLARAGWGAAYAPAAEVLHIQGVSTDRRPYRMIVEHHRSLVRFAWRSTVGWRRLLLPLVTAGIGVRGVLAGVRRLSAR